MYLSGKMFRLSYVQIISFCSIFILNGFLLYIWGFGQFAPCKLCRQNTQLRSDASSSETERWRRISEDELETKRQELRDTGSAIISEILSVSGLDELNRRIRFGDVQDNLQGRRKHGTEDTHQVVEEFHEAIAILLQRVFGDVNVVTYSFALEYNENSSLPPHLELVSNEISATLCFFRDNESELFFDELPQENKYASRYTTSGNYTIPLSRVRRISLRAGDIGIFNGRNHYHWREKSKVPLTWRGILFHFMHNYTKEEHEEQISWGDPDPVNGLSGDRYRYEAPVVDIDA